MTLALLAIIAQSHSNVVLAPVPHFKDAVLRLDESVTTFGFSQKDLPLLFDGDNSTLAKTPGVSPATLKFKLRETQKIDAVRITTSYGKYRIRLFASPTESNPLTRVGDGHMLADFQTLSTNHNSLKTLHKLSNSSDVRNLTIEITKLTGDKVIHLNELSILKSSNLNRIELSYNSKQSPRLFPTWQIELNQILILDDGQKIPNEESDAVGFRLINENDGILVENKLKLLKPGPIAVETTFRNLKSQSVISVAQPARSPLFEDYEDLATPMSNYVWEVPFVVINYIPTIDGKVVDSSITPSAMKVNDKYFEILKTIRNEKFMIEESSRYHGYKNPSARPSLGYRLVKLITFFEDVPKGVKDKGSPGYYPDYGSILDRVNAKSLVNDHGVKEFWIGHWHNDRLVPVESNMSSKVSGDISNSYRIDDLPVFESSYTVYIGPWGPGGSLHCKGHQMEAVLSYIDNKQNKNTKLFNQLFVGLNEKGQFIPGRVGNCHFPPNGRKDYDYYNMNAVESDIEDWRPDGSGRRTLVNKDTWEQIPYQFPTGDSWKNPRTGLKGEAHWYMYWFQNFPGHDAKIDYQGGKLTNWWRFFGDWDGAMKENYGLWR